MGHTRPAVRSRLGRSASRGLTVKVAICSFAWMFYYFGSKERLSAKYPHPRFDAIIEPFAGSAGYARLHWKHNVILVEKDERVVDLWERLRGMTPEQALAIPPPTVGERSSDLLVMLRAASEHSLTGEYITVTDRMVSRWPHLLRRIADNIPKVQHWRIICGDFTDAPDIEATWFIDPPYEMMRRGYRHSGLDYSALATWCQERAGQVIVCEQHGADWLPFEPLADALTTNNTRKTEVVWYGGVRAN